MDQNSSDYDLVAAFRGGDVQSFRFLIERYQGRLYMFVLHSLDDQEATRDIVQETFIEFMRFCRELEDQKEPRVLVELYRIALRKINEHIRSSVEVPQTNLSISVSSTGRAPSASRRPDEDIRRGEIYTRVMEAMKTLDPDTRETILLREIEGLSYEEIADCMDVPEGTVRSRLHRARVNLRELLADLR